VIIGGSNSNYSHNAKESPHKPFLGTRKVEKKEDGKTGKFSYNGAAIP
jgi:hypothetical protein